MPRIFDEAVWAGTEASLQSMLAADEVRAEKLEAFQQQEETQEGSRILDVQDGLGVVSIKGTLNNDEDAQWNEWVGATGYPEIREALIDAAQDPDVRHILLDVDSGGGAVSGVEDTAALIRLINDTVKPVTAFTDGSMYSAAYWLASAAGEIHATKSAGVGSIGVIAVHSERSKAYAEAGIGVSVIRAGKYKALANSVEPLSEEGRAQIQAKVDASYKIFVETVANNRGKTYDYADQVMAQGREFIGASAADAGLVDSITTYDSLATKLKLLIDSSKNLMENRAKQSSNGLRVETLGDAGMARKMLSEKEVAALASGASLEANASPVEAEEKVEVASDAAPEVKAEADTPVETTVEAAKEAAEVDNSASALKFMRDELKAAQADLLAAQIKSSKLEDKVADLEAVVGPLKDIAAKATNNMRVALGGTAMDMAAVSATQILAEHASISATFATKFKVGGVAAVDAEARPQTKEKFEMDSALAARINAVRGK